MGWLIIGIILAIAGIVLLVGAKAFAGEDGKTGGYRALGVVLIVLFIPLFALSGLKSVPVKNIGVPQSFGAVHSGFFEPGIHETWDPFLHLTDINETIQTTTFQTGGTPSQGGILPGTSQCNGALPVRIGGQQQACAKITIQWQVRPSAAGALFSDYANQGDLMTTVENALVIRELELVVNQEVGDYDPISDYQSVVNTSSQTSQFTSFGPAIQATMTKDIGSQIIVRSVLFPYMAYSAQVESKLQQIQQAYANFAIAQENVKVNAQNKLAFASLGTPTVDQLIAQCLQDSRENKTSPMGCFPGQASGLTIGK